MRALHEFTNVSGSSADLDASDRNYSVGGGCISRRVHVATLHLAATIEFAYGNAAGRAGGAAVLV